MLKTHRAGERRSLFTGHSDVHFVSAHVEHDGRGGVRAKGGYVLCRGEEDRVAASVAAEATAGGRETEATAGGRETAAAAAAAVAARDTPTAGGGETAARAPVEREGPAKGRASTTCRVNAAQGKH
ncbi:unnamed protein product, partial [Ectocarpus sp. 12 AP-2014]